MPYLTWVMSKFLNLGLTLEQVVAMATINPAKVINRAPKLGTLQVGAPADVSLLEVEEGRVEFVDTRNNKRQGKIHLKPSGVVMAGVPYGRPYRHRSLCVKLPVPRRVSQVSHLCRSAWVWTWHFASDERILMTALAR